ncbi:MAG: hypothetical protein O9333_10360 [Beijerinckiaceae bacterium]|jgi:hypothetical protein|nr:hypothetical protein [Beijerinckiaceae bacterium]
MMKQVVKALAVLGLLVMAAMPAFAKGPGDYRVQGKEGTSGGGYTGSASLTQTGAETWRIVWKIGSQTWTGFGIGNGEVVALNFTGNGRTGVMLLIAKEDGSGYAAAWAYTGEKEVGYEEWTKRR